MGKVLPFDRPLNILGTVLRPCCTNPMTGFFRDGFCRTNDMDPGVHSVCVVITEAFLIFSKSRGNDLSTPMPEFQFPGLKEGDCWCLCALRWKEAFEAGCAPHIRPESTHKKTLDLIRLSDMKPFFLMNH